MLGAPAARDRRHERQVTGARQASPRRPRPAVTAPGEAPTTVVIATRDRRDSLLHTLDRLRDLPEEPPVVVVDNGSADGTPRAVRRRHAGVDVIETGRNLGPAARTVGARRASTPFVAFSDDDSWWAPHALARAAHMLRGHDRLALVAARIIVEPGGWLDPTCRLMAQSPLAPDAVLGRPRVLGFLACGAVVRRSAFLAVGGFSPRLAIGGEEGAALHRPRRCRLDAGVRARGGRPPSPRRDGRSREGAAPRRAAQRVVDRVAAPAAAARDGCHGGGSVVVRDPGAGDTCRRPARAAVDPAAAAGGPALDRGAAARGRAVAGGRVVVRSDRAVPRRSISAVTPTPSSPAPGRGAPARGRAAAGPA